LKIEIKTVKLSQIKLNPDNPRQISEKDMDRLVKSLADFPDMLNIREIVVDETMTVLGGNMRYLALQKIKAKDCTAKIVAGLTPEQKREFIIKDNGNFGTFDMDSLANAWSDLPLIDWGVKGMNLGIDDPDAEWQDMPEVGDTTKGIKQILIHFETMQDVKDFSEFIGQNIGEKTKSIWYPQKDGIQDES
jgi:hypothetical protein